MEDCPTIIIDNVDAEDMKMLVEYCYHGEVNVPPERMNSFFAAAQFLKIVGLMDVSLATTNHPIVISYIVIPLFQCNTIMDAEIVTERDSIYQMDVPEDKVSDMSNTVVTVTDLDDTNSDAEVLEKKKRRKRDPLKKEYNDNMLTDAINDLKEGHSLLQAATKNNIPRSTLYMKAKSLGIELNTPRNEYPVDSMRSAINSVLRKTFIA